MSRYSDEDEYDLVDSSGNSRKAITFREIDRSYNPDSDSVHIVRDNDNLFTLATQYYDDFRLWYKIADKNPDITNPFCLNVGSQIVIPSLLDDEDLENSVDEDYGDDDDEYGDDE